jgi:hypothetical protein
MGLDLIDDRHTELSAGGHYVGSAWLLAVVVVTLLLTVAAPFL